MRKRRISALSLILAVFACSVLIATNAGAAPVAGSSHLRAGAASVNSVTGTTKVISEEARATKATENVELDTNVSYVASTPFSGITRSVNNYLLNASYIADVTVSENSMGPVADMEYADIAVAQVDNYVNIRSLPSTSGDVIGKLYNNSACQITGSEDGPDGDGRWYRITSGKCDGYVRAEYVVAGDPELAKKVSRRVATVATDILNIREGASMEAEIIGQLSNGDDLTVIDESIKDQGWVMVTCERGDGYVSMDYVTLSTSYTLAESKAEEEARLAREEAARKAAIAAAQRKANAGGTQYYYVPSNNGSGAQYVIDYAKQFLGCPYVHGGSSITGGTDCSGFVMLIYAHFGVSLPRADAPYRNVGYAVSYDNMQPGDIVCYSGHVGLYAGNGLLLHDSNPRDGVKYSPVNYREILAIRRIF